MSITRPRDAVVAARSLACLAFALTVLAGRLPGQTRITVDSIAELRRHAGASDAVVTLAPGAYSLAGDGRQPHFLRFTGRDTTYDLTGVTFRVDSRSLRGYGGGHQKEVCLIALYGEGLTVKGFTLSTEFVDGQIGWSDSATNSIRIAGRNNTVRDAKITARGSTPYGYGDAFGKGGRVAGRPFVSFHKHCGIQFLESIGGTIDNVELEMKAFGHGVYIQASSDTKILNTRVTGEMCSSNDVIAHPQYQKFGFTIWGEPIPPDILLSECEDGIRAYGEVRGATTRNVHVENVVVRNMREAFSLFAAKGQVVLSHCEAYGSEVAFEPGSGNLLRQCKGDAVNGPLLFFRRPGLRDAQVEIELVGDRPPTQPWPLAIISGTGHRIELTSSARPDAYPTEASVNLSQRWNEWRHHHGPIDETDATRNVTIVNRTRQPLVIGPRAAEIHYVSDGPVVNKGAEMVKRMDQE